MISKVSQYEVFLVNLNPTIGSEINKVRPCLVISPNEINYSRMRTVIIAPMTTKAHTFPTRIPLRFQSKSAWIVLDQIRTIDRSRLIKSLGIIQQSTIKQVKDCLRVMFVE
jgi:mRNA interferase MazF